MKKSTRLTALLLALLLLLASLSASATENENVLLIDGLTLDDYVGLVSDAESVGLRISEECGSLNPYCASANKLIGMTSAQARYDYLATMTSVDAANVLLHYDLKHADANALCLCAYPYFDADYVPGGSNHEADCPWHADNLPVQEEERDTTLECPSELCTYVDDGYIGEEFFSMDAFHRYEVLYEMYNNAADETAKSEFSTFTGHLYDFHTDVFCQCIENPFEVHPTYDIGLDTHTGYINSDGEVISACPWRIEALTTAEQAYVIHDMDSAEQDAYKKWLSAAQKDALTAYMAGISATDVTLGSSDIGIVGSAQIAAGVFGDTHVLQAGEAPLVVEMENALKAQSIGHTLAAFDVQFLNLNRPGEVLQPVSGQTVQMTFTVDLNKVDGDAFQVYRLEKNGSGYTATAVGEKVPFTAADSEKSVVVDLGSAVYAVRFECSGDSCGYNAFWNMTGFEREAYLEDLVASEDENAYMNFVGHINGYHYNDEPVHCTCSDYETNYAALGYGTIAHGKDNLNNKLCPWHFAQIPVEDEYTIYTALSETDKEAYLATITDAAKRAELLAMVNPPQIDTPEWDASTSEFIELSFVQEGAAGYQWYKSTDNGATWEAIENATGSKLVLDIKNDNDALGYAYKCDAIFADGTIISSVAMGLIDYDMRTWVLSDEIEVTKEMLNRALEVEEQINELGLNFTALQAMRIETTQLMSVYTGQPVADYDTETGALVDISTGLTVGYLKNGAIEAPADDVTGGETAGDDTANN